MRQHNQVRLPSQEIGGLGVSEIKKAQFEGVVVVAGGSAVLCGHDMLIAGRPVVVGGAESMPSWIPAFAGMTVMWEEGGRSCARPGSTPWN